MRPSCVLGPDPHPWFPPGSRAWSLGLSQGHGVYAQGQGCPDRSDGPRGGPQRAGGGGAVSLVTLVTDVLFLLQSSAQAFSGRGYSVSSPLPRPSVPLPLSLRVLSPPEPPLEPCRGGPQGGLVGRAGEGGVHGAGDGLRGRRFRGRGSCRVALGLRGPGHRAAVPQ